MNELPIEFEQLLWNAADAAWISDQRGMILWANEAAELLTGHGNGLWGMDVNSLHDGHVVLDHGRSLLPEPSVLPLRRADGKQRMVSLAISANHLEGQRDRFLFLARDVTREQEMRRLLEYIHDHAQSSRKAMIDLLDELEAGALILDGEGRIIHCNRGAKNLMRPGMDEPTEQFWRDVFMPVQGGKQALQKLIRKTPSKWIASLWLQTAKEGKRFVRWDIRDRTAPGDGWLIFLYDETDLEILRGELTRKKDTYGLIGASEGIVKVHRIIEQVAAVNAPLLIEGETGTGKDLAARAVHQASHRSTKPFIAVNCAGLEDSLLSSTLFGHRKGAFTGATEDRPGVFEAADEGTLFLDEVGDMPDSVQVRLLRALESGEILRLGESVPRKVDVRIIAASQFVLEDQVEAGRFRRDLLYRLRVARLTMPPLRDRKADLPVLASWFREQGNQAFGVDVQIISQSAMRRLLAHDWPGNVRELRNVVEYALIHSPGEKIDEDSLPPELYRSAVAAPASEQLPGDEDRQRIMDALEAAGGNRARAAVELGVSRTTFYRWLRNLGFGRKPGYGRVG